MNRKRLTYTVIAGIAAAGILSLIFTELRAESKRTCSVPILMYHDVGETANSPWCVPIETFRSQMTSLREQGYKTILPSDIIAHRKWGKVLPRKPVIITFDDGYLSALAIIEPILKENGLRAVSYLITGQVAETADDRREYEGKKCLIWPEVLAMQQRGTFVFGGHSHAHNNLAGDSNPWAQIAECRRQLRLHGIRKPYSFCYPYGQQNERTQKAVIQAKFQTAVVCEDAVAPIGPKTSLFILPRVSVMGGKHEFRLISGDLEADKQTLVCRIFHSGIPIEISACLQSTDNIIRKWLPPGEIPYGEFGLRFVLANDVAEHTQDTIEIWDKHRLFKLARFGPILPTVSLPAVERAR